MNYNEITPHDSFIVENGVLVKYSGTASEVKIPDGITYIGYLAFYGCKNLASIAIPDSVTIIGHSAFKGCDNLTSITIPDSVTDIGDNVFSNCINLTDITISRNAESIGDAAFFHCEKLKSVIIPESVKSIGVMAFYGCTELKSITIPDSVTDIGIGAFDLTAWLKNQKDEYVVIGKGILYKYLGAGGDVKIPEGITSIASVAFENSEITSVVIPDSVSNIGFKAFYNCKSLKSITIPENVSSIGASAFNFCENLTSIKIPKSVRTVGYNAFENTGWLANNKDEFIVLGNILYKYNGNGGDIEIPDGITFIVSGAFEDCENITSVTMPCSIESYDLDIFTTYREQYRDNRIRIFQKHHKTPITENS